MGVAEKLSAKKYSVATYLELEAQADYKSEYWDGLIVKMAGGTPAHSKIANSIGTAIDNEQDRKEKNNSVYSCNQKVHVPVFNCFAYPDCMVVCGAEELHSDSQTVLTNPCLIIEVLSESTKAYDSTTKFEGYRSIPSFQEYVLIWQTIPKVQAWYKEAEEVWRISSAFGLDTHIKLHTLDCEIALADIYKRVSGLGERDEPDSY